MFFNDDYRLFIWQQTKAVINVITTDETAARAWAREEGAQIPATAHPKVYLLKGRPEPLCIVFKGT